MHPRLHRTVAISRLALSRADGLAVLLASGLVYLATFLWAGGNLSIRPGLGVGLTVVDDPMRLFFRRQTPVSFEPIAVLDLEVLRVLVSPMDVGLGLLIAGLVGLNFAIAVLAIRQPKACGIGAGAGVGAAVPALFSGFACCAPVLFLVLGIQATGAMLTVLPWMLPIGLVLLLASLAYVAGKVDPTLLEAARNDPTTDAMKTSSE